jgi:hypothetical protein
MAPTCRRIRTSRGQCRSRPARQARMLLPFQRNAPKSSNQRIYELNPLNQEFNPDQPSEATDNKELAENTQGEGVGRPPN